MSDARPDFFADLVAEAPIPARGIHSQTMSEGGGTELVLFAFAAGEALSEHTSARSTIIHVLSGRGRPDRRRRPSPGWSGDVGPVAPDVRHGIVARTPLVMALYLLPG